jgi:single-stranded-DNA-specific exonuclease
MSPDLAFAELRAPAATARCESAPALGVDNSFAGRFWRPRPCDEDLARALEHKGLPPALARVLASRGVTPAAAAGFLAPRLKDLLPDPDSLAQMDVAAERFARAITHREIIGVFGDYDVDGACASALLLRFVRALGGRPELYIPDRLTEGYGPNAGAMRHLKAKGVSLVVTVDCGAAAHDALHAARAEGMDVVVLDHHAVDSNPPAFAHVNPNGPDDLSGLNQLCAAGVAFCLMVAVQRLLRITGWFDSAGIEPMMLLDQLDLVALATVADVVPLTGVNRAFVRQGLKKLERMERPGLRALAQLASATPPFSPYHLGFIFGPRINAGGRVGRCDLGARLLATDDASEAEALALELDRHNRERQGIEAGILEQADALALTQCEKPYLLLAGEGWHAGVVGIVASRLKERHNKPVLVAGFVDGAPASVGRGSGRSVPGVDLGAAVRSAFAAGLLEAGGGHAMAAGFSVTRSRMAELGAFLDGELEPQRAQVDASRELVFDTLISARAATLALLAEIEGAGPYGTGHPEPLFLMPDMTVAYAGVVGKGHVRLRLIGRDAGGMDAIAFRAANGPLGQALLKARGARIHVVGRLKRDDYGGVARVQLQIEDAAAAGA